MIYPVSLLSVDDLEVKEENNAISFAVAASPRASKSAIIGVHDKALKIKLAAPPIDGAANKKLIAYFSKMLKITKSNITIISGESSKRKRVRITGVDKATLLFAIDRL